MNDLTVMLALARSVRVHAYAPYSNYHVGAVLRAANGKLYVGCNVENAAYPEGICAEAGAIAAMVADGERQIEAVVVMGPKGELCTPCGGCRQKLREFGNDATTVHITDPDEVLMSSSLGELLPHAFGPENLR